MGSSLADRVGSLVERVHGGNVNQAAKEIGISQPTLSRIVSGEVTNPRTVALTKISQHYMASMDWLLTGSGARPRVLEVGDSVPGLSTHANVVARWRLSINRLNLPADLRSMLFGLPYHTAAAVQILDELLPDDESTAQALKEAVEHEHLAWLTLLLAALKYRGERGVAETFERYARALKGLSPPPVEQWETLKELGSTQPNKKPTKKRA